MTDDENRPVLCRVCKVRAELRVQSDRRREVACPTCGTALAYDDFKRELIEQGQEYMREYLLRGFRRPGSKWKVTKSLRPKRLYRFIVDFEASQGDDPMLTRED